MEKVKNGRKTNLDLGYEVAVILLLKIGNLKIDNVKNERKTNSDLCLDLAVVLPDPIFPL